MGSVWEGRSGLTAPGARQACAEKKRTQGGAFHLTGGGGAPQDSLLPAG
jgi:hypothetical protein